MILNPFSYQAPETLEEAISLLSNTENALLSGDQSQIDDAKKGKISGDSLVSLRKIDALKSIVHRENLVEIGSAVTFGAILADPAISSVSVLKEALQAIGDPHLRNHSNIGGAVYHNAPSHASVLAALLAVDAQLNFSGAHGDSQIGIQNYLENYGATSFKKGEILKTIVFEKDKSSSGSFHYIDYLKSGKIVCGVALVVNKEHDVITKIRIAVSGCVRIPMRLTQVEQSLIGKEINRESVAEALKSLSGEALEISNPFIANPSYLFHLLKVLLKRAISKS